MKNINLALFAVVLFAPLCVNASYLFRTKSETPHIEIVSREGFVDGSTVLVFNPEAGQSQEHRWGGRIPLNSADIEMIAIYGREYLAQHGYFRRKPSDSSNGTETLMIRGFNSQKVDCSAAVECALKKAREDNAKLSRYAAVGGFAGFVLSRFSKNSSAQATGWASLGAGTAAGVNAAHQSGYINALLGRKSDGA